MQIKVELSNGYLPDRFGKHADEKYLLHGLPVRSFPIQISDLPTDTQALALILIDYDAVPVAGFPWIHWLATDIAVTDEIPENASIQNQNMVQGKNSWDSRYVEMDDPAIVERYGGPKPPADHDYTLTVYALRAKTDLKPGFYMNDLLRQVEALALDEATIKLKAKG
jgi:Raf kinase inhibitor-like YbhB/YbcL family protein